MTDRVIQTRPLTASAFAPFGDVLEATGEADVIINQGMCGRYHDCAGLEFLPSETGDQGRAGISLFKAEPRALPYQLDMVERHPLGSQAFLPMSQTRFLVIVAEDENDQPGLPHAFLTGPGQGINLHRNVWHGVLTPLEAPGLFAVVDRIGTGNNLQEFWFDSPYRVMSDMWPNQ